MPPHRLSGLGVEGIDRAVATDDEEQPPSGLQSELSASPSSEFPPLLTGVEIQRDQTSFGFSEDDASGTVETSDLSSRWRARTRTKERLPPDSSIS